MRTSRRARRMQRHHGRLSQRRGLNLVSLMDVFTILVFFLLVNTSDVQNLPDPKELSLPESKAETPAPETTVVMLTREGILVNGSRVIDNQAVLASDDPTIPELAQALAAEAPKRTRPAAQRSQATEGQAATAESPQATRGPLTIMADKGLPYRLIRKVMMTSSATEFGKISLAVLQEGGS